jgi:hypothetical protein
MERKMVLASATVDVIRPSTPQKLGLFNVHVWGQPPHAEKRDYELLARNDTMAAQEGIRRFVAEMERISVEGG